MKNILISIFLFPAFCASALSTPVKDELGAYYHHIYAAEQLVLKSDYKSATIQHDSAFHFKNSPFTTDIYNNLICILLTKENNKEAYNLCEHMIMRGANLSFFNKAVFLDLKKTVFWDDLKMKYRSLVIKRDTRKRRSLISQLDSLNHADQIIHCELPLNYKDSLFLKRMHDLDSKNGNSLSLLLQKFDCLSEIEIGSNFSDTEFSTQPLYSLLVLHEFQRNGEILSQLIKNGIIAGKIRSDVGLGWLENDGSSKLIFLGDYKKYNGNIYVRKLDSLTMKLSRRSITRIIGDLEDNKASALRLLYYVDNPESIIAKLIYNCRNQTFQFYTPVKSFKVNEDQLKQSTTALKLVYECIDNE